MAVSKPPFEEQQPTSSSSGDLFGSTRVGGETGSGERKMLEICLVRPESEIP